MFQFNAKFAFHVLQISLFYFWSMFCLKRIAQIFACRAVNIQIEFLAAKYLRNVLAGTRWCYTRWYHVSTHQSWYVIYNCTPIIIPGFLAPAGRHTIYIFVPPQHLDIWSGPVILMSIVTPECVCIVPMWVCCIVYPFLPRLPEEWREWWWLYLHSSPSTNH